MFAINREKEIIFGSDRMWNRFNIKKKEEN